MYKLFPAVPNGEGSNEEGSNEVNDMSKNAEMIQQLKAVKGILVSKELRGDDWEEMQSAVSKLEEVVSYINDCSGKGIQF